MTMPDARDTAPPRDGEPNDDASEQERNPLEELEDPDAELDEPIE